MNLHKPALLLLLLCFAATSAWCNDRPFQSARTAVLEDDEYTWSIETWVQRYGRVRGLSFEPEYIFGGGFSIQSELTKLKDRDGNESGHEAEIELKQVFNNIARDGWGLGLSAAFSRARLGDDAAIRTVTLKLPLSLALGQSRTLLHLNVGAEKTSGHKREWNTAVALEREVYRRTWLIAEFSKTGEEKFAQIGVRHWLRKERMALDFTLQQQRKGGDGSGRRASGFILGLGFYDL